MSIVCKAPKSPIVESFPILLLDSTGSMNYEYNFIINAWKLIFNELGANKLEYQWEDGLFPFDSEFRCAGEGDITKTFLQIFDILLKQNFPKNITIIFVSDGQELFVPSELDPIIPLITDKFIVQFIAVAVGGSFPGQISMTLRESLHKQNPSCPPVYLLQRWADRTDQEIQKFFEDTFRQIRGLLKVSQDLLDCDQDVLQTIVSKPTRQVISDSVFLAQSPVTINNQVIQPSKSPEDAKALIVNSVQQALIQYGSHPSDQVYEDFTIIKNVSEQIKQEIPIVNDQLLNNVENLVTQFTEGNIDLSKLDEQKLTQLQPNLENVQKITAIINDVQTSDSCTAINKKLQASLRPKCLSSSKLLIKPIPLKDIVEKDIQKYVSQMNKIIEDTLQKYLIVFNKDKSPNYIKPLSVMYQTIEDCVNKIAHLEPKDIDDDFFVHARTLNSILEFLQKINEEKQITWDKGCIILNSALQAVSISRNNKQINKRQYNFSFLPFFPKKLIEDTPKNIFLTIIDQNMIDEYQLIQNQFVEVFAQSKENQVNIISWKNNKFIGPQQTFEKIDDLITIRRNSFDDDQEKNIYLSVISDGKADNQLLFKQLTNIELNRSVRLTFIAVCKKFKLTVEEEFKDINKQNIKKPIILGVPKQKKAKKTQKVRLFMNAFQNLEQRLKQEREASEQHQAD